MENQLDQQAVNLAKAIRYHESGTDYNKLGDGGKSAGAYQWSNGQETLAHGEIPENFKQHARDYGLDENDFTPYNQDIVAYHVIKSLKDKGLNVPQIAAKWNGGDENRYDPNYITPNGLPSQKDGEYDVPAYANSVNELYQQIKQEQPQTPQDFQQAAGATGGGDVSSQREQMIAAGQPVSNNPSKASPSFLGNLVRGITKPFVRGALPFVGLGNAVMQNINQASGNTEAAQRQAEFDRKLQNKGIQSNYYGTLYPSGYGVDKNGESFSPTHNVGKSVLDTAGNAAEIASNFVGAGEALPIVKSLGKEGLLQLAKHGAIAGAKSGLVGGVGQGLQQAATENTVGTGVKDVISGGVQGGLLGGLTGGVLAPVGGVASKSVNILKGKYAPSIESGNSALLNIKDAIYKHMGLTQEEIDKQIAHKNGGTDLSGNPIVRNDAIEVLAKNDAINPNIDSTNKLYAKNKEYSAAAKDWAGKETAQFPIDETISNIKQNIENYTTSGVEAEKIVKQIDDEVAALERQGKIPTQQLDDQGKLLPRSVSADVLERLRKTANEWAFNQNKVRNNPELETAGKLLGNSVRDTIETHGTFPEYRSFNREWGDLINARNFHNEMLQGGKKAISNGDIIKLIGLKSNSVTGKILDKVGLNSIFEYANNPNFKTYFDKQVLSATDRGFPSESSLEKLKKQLSEYLVPDNSAPTFGKPVDGISKPKGETLGGRFKGYKIVNGKVVPLE